MLLNNKATIKMLNSYKTFTQIRLFSFNSRLMSVYPPHFIEPIILDKSDLKNQKELNQYAHIPIRPARNNDSTSIYCNPVVNKFINYITRGGNKELARELISQTFDIIKRTQLERLNSSSGNNQNVICCPEELLTLAVENSRPLLQLTAIKRGGVTYQVPMPVTEKRSKFLASKWLLEAAREKDKKLHFPQKFAWEIIDAANGQGKVVKKKNDLHIQCESNRAYAHYRWS